MTCFTERSLGWVVVERVVINNKITLEPGTKVIILGTREIGQVKTKDTDVRSYINKINDVYISIIDKDANKEKKHNRTVVLSEGGLKHLIQACV